MESDLSQIVIQTLHRVQSERDYSLRGMALKLRISAGHLSMLYSGQRNVGIGLLLAALREFPEVRQALVSYLASASPPSEG